MKIVVNKMVIDDNNNIEYSANGIESVTGGIGHHIMFTLLKKYQDVKNKVTQNYFECVTLEQMAKDFNFKIIENVYSY